MWRTPSGVVDIFEPAPQVVVAKAELSLLIAAMVTAPEASVSSAQAATPTPAASAKAPSPVAAADSRKRTRSASQAEEAALASIQSAVAAAAMAAAAGAADDAITESESEAAMSEVMKEVEGSAGAFEASAGAAAVVPKDENGAADDVAAVEAGAEAAAELGRSQLYESKRMARVSFSSWFEFDAYFEMYMQDTFQPFRMRSSCSVEAYRRNQQKVMMNNKNSRGRRIEFPDEAIHHHRIYMCTHAMKARCRGATTRPGQKYRGIGCIAKINVKISPSENPSKYMVIVTDQVGAVGLVSSFRPLLCLLTSG